MNNEILPAIITAVLGGSGLSALIVNAIANRKKTKAEAELVTAGIEKVKADCLAALSDAYEDRLRALGDRVKSQEERVEYLEEQVSTLKSTLIDREVVIATLQRENVDLTKQVDVLSGQVKCRDKRIKELERQVAELTEKINALSGD